MRKVDLLNLMESRREYMRISVKTPVETVDVNAWDELLVDDHDLNTEFMAISGQIAYWTAVAARFEQAVDVTRRNFDTWYAPLYEEEFAALEKATGRKPNISSAEYMVKIHHKDDYNKWRDLLGQAEADLKIVQGMVPALQAKLQALIQLAKKQSVEYNSTEVFYKGSGLQTPRPFTPQKANTESIEEAKDVLRKMRSQDVPF